MPSAIISPDSLSATDDDFRTDVFAPKKFAGKMNEKRAWAIEQMKYTAKAAENLGIEIVTGFTGSPIWHMLYSFPPVPKKTIDDGFDFLAEMWHPILDVFEDHGVKFALEVHPTEIAFDIDDREAHPWKRWITARSSDSTSIPAIFSGR